MLIQVTQPNAIHQVYILGSVQELQLSMRATLIGIMRHYLQPRDMIHNITQPRSSSNPHGRLGYIQSLQLLCFDNSE
jgi:hypothetical protein